MDKKKVGIAVGCAAVAAVIAICAVTFGGKKGDATEPAATVETAATAEPAATPEVTATPAPTEAPTATPEPMATPEPTAAPTPVVTAAPQPVVTAAPQPVQQEPSSDDGGEVPDWVDTSDTPLVSDEEYQAAITGWDDVIWE